MARVTARELHSMGVKSGPDLPLPIDAVESAKAKTLMTLEETYGSDTTIWIRVLKHAKEKITKEPYQTAISQLLAELEKEEK